MKQPDKIILKFMIHKKVPSYLGELQCCPSMGLLGRGNIEMFKGFPIIQVFEAIV